MFCLCILVGDCLSLVLPAPKLCCEFKCAILCVFLTTSVVAQTVAIVKLYSLTVINALLTYLLTFLLKPPCVLGGGFKGGVGDRFPLLTQICF